MLPNKTKRGRSISRDRGGSQRSRSKSKESKDRSRSRSKSGDRGTSSSTGNKFIQMRKDNKEKFKKMQASVRRELESKGRIKVQETAMERLMKPDAPVPTNTPRIKVAPSRFELVMNNGYQSSLSRNASGTSEAENARLRKLANERAAEEAERMRLQRKAEEDRKKAEAEEYRLHQEALEKQRKVEEEIARLRLQKQAKEGQKRAAQEEERKRLLYEAEQLRLKRETEEEQRRVELERIRMRREAEEEQRKIEAERVRLEREAAEDRRRREAERVRLEREAAEERRRREAERVRLEREAAEERRKLEAERVRLEREAAEEQRRLEAEQLRVQREAETEERRRFEIEMKQQREEHRRMAEGMDEPMPYEGGDVIGEEADINAEEEAYNLEPIAASEELMCGRDLFTISTNYDQVTREIEFFSIEAKSKSAKLDDEESETNTRCDWYSSIGQNETRKHIEMETDLNYDHPAIKKAILKAPKAYRHWTEQQMSEFMESIGISTKALPLVDVLKKYRLVRRIKQGKFSEVNLKEKKRAYYVTKERIIHNKADFLDVMNEKSFLEKTDSSPFTPKFHDLFMYTYCGCYVMTTVMEFLDGVDLSRLNWNMRNKIHIYYSIHEICKFLKYIHKMGWIYLDLKLDNVILTRNGDVKVVDFETCRARNDADTFQGSLWYMAPEVANKVEFENSLVTHTADLFSLGVIVYVLVFKNFPFIGTDIHSYLELLQSEPPYGFPDEYKELDPILRNLLSLNKNRDIHFEKLVNITQHENVDSFKGSMFDEIIRTKCSANEKV